ncbi:MAG: serine hydrolase [Parvularculaceae bacterium]
MLHVAFVALAAVAASDASSATLSGQSSNDADALVLAQTRATTTQERKPRRVAPVRRRAVLRATVALAAFHDPASIGWYFRYGLTSNGYSSAWETYKNRGYLPIDIETDRIGGRTRYSGVWQKNEDGRGWVSYRNLTSSGFHDKWEEYKNKGYRPIDQDAEVIGGSVRYSLVMVENKEGVKWVSNRNLTSAQFSQKFNQYKGAYMPIDVDAVEVNGSMRYSIIWVENKANTGWVELRDMTPATYGQKFQQYRSQDYRVADLDCYSNNGNLRYAAIWEKNKPGRAWAARRQMSGRGLANWWKKYRDQGMRVIDIEVCPAKSGGGVQYAAVWRENESRYDWSGRTSAENEVKKYVDNSDAPSVGAAIMRNGQLLFRGGAGEADTQNGVWAHGGTIYRLASVSKAVTGVLAYDMEEAGLIDLDDRTDTIVSGLGSNHAHTVRQLVRMEGCVSHYQSDGVNDNATQVKYTTAQSALDNHMGGAIKTNGFIISGCSTGQYNYSTHSYVPAAAALEAKGGTSFANLLKTRISDPMNLGTLRVESRTSPDPSGELAEVYANGGRVSDVNFQNITWKMPSGGMESSAADLARFGDAVLRNRYFPQTTRDAMWNGTQNGRAGGWTVSGVQRWKTGGQQASDTYIVIDTNTGVTVVVLANLSSPSIDTTTLANTLLGIANAN